jgi:hypothetical protein
MGINSPIAIIPISLIPYIFHHLNLHNKVKKEVKSPGQNRRTSYIGFAFSPLLLALEVSKATI